MSVGARPGDFDSALKPSWLRAQSDHTSATRCSEITHVTLQRVRRPFYLDRDG